MPEEKKVEEQEEEVQDINLDDLTPEQEQEIMRTGTLSPEKPVEKQAEPPAGEEEKGASATGEQEIPPEETPPTGAKVEDPATQQPTTESLQAQIEQLKREKSGIEREREKVLESLVEARAQRRSLYEPQTQQPPQAAQKPPEVKAEENRLAELQKQIQDDDFVDGKTLKSVLGEVAELQKREIDRYRQEQEQTQRATAQNALRTRMEESAVAAKQKYADYDQKMAVFHEMVQKNPNYGLAMLRSENPAEEAYNIATNLGSFYQPAGTPQAPPPAQTVQNPQPQRKVPRLVQGAGGKGGPPRTTIEAAANMTEDEFARLPNEEKVRLLRGF